VLLLGIVATLLVVPRPQHCASIARRAVSAQVGRFVSWLSTYAFLMGAGSAAVLAFIVLYSVEVLDFSPTRAGLVAALIGGASVVARVWWGRITERTATPTGPLFVVAALSVGAQALIWSAEGIGEWVLWLGAVVFGATAASWNAVGMLAIVRELDAGETGHATGIVQSAFYVGLLICPIVFGWSVDVTGAYDAGWAGVTAAFVAATVLVAVWHVTRRRAVDQRNARTRP
jgi:nitrate/nitrite transporter NarK